MPYISIIPCISTYCTGKGIALFATHVAFDRCRSTRCTCCGRVSSCCSEMVVLKFLPSSVQFSKILTLRHACITSFILFNLQEPRSFTHWSQTLLRQWSLIQLPSLILPRLGSSELVAPLMQYDESGQTAQNLEFPFQYNLTYVVSTMLSSTRAMCQVVCMYLIQVLLWRVNSHHASLHKFCNLRLIVKHFLCQKSFTFAQLYTRFHKVSILGYIFFDSNKLGPFSMTFLDMAFRLDN